LTRAGAGSAFGSTTDDGQGPARTSPTHMITSCSTGYDNLVLAETNEEGSHLLDLQTRQSLSTTAMSLANQSNQGGSSSCSVDARAGYL